MQRTLFEVGKQPGQPLAATSAGLIPSRLFFVTDRSSGLRFLVDTGTEVSVVPPSRAERKHRQDGLTLQAVNNTSIATYGKRSLTLDLGLRRTFRWVFVIADVKNPILGADFLRNYSFLVDVGHNRLSDALTQLKVQGIASHASSPSPTLLPRRPETILSKFSMVTHPCNSQQPVKHDVTHHIKTTCPPVCART